MTSIAEKRRRFRALHQEGCFVIPNPWDAGSARMLEALGFKAVASSSAGFAWTLGRPDYGCERDDVLAHLTALAAAVDIPVNADFETGFADAPGAVAENVRMAIATGIAGLSIEDRVLGAPGRLHDRAFAVERITAARRAIDRSGEDVVLVARAEGLLIDPEATGPVTDALVAFAAAGADCLFAPGVKHPEHIAAMVRAVAPLPLNVVAVPGLSVAALADLGVRRISVGGGLARVAWAAAIDAAQMLASGSFEGLTRGAASKQLNDMFSG